MQAVRAAEVVPARAMAEVEEQVRPAAQVVRAAEVVPARAVAAGAEEQVRPAVPRAPSAAVPPRSPRDRPPAANRLAALP